MRFADPLLAGLLSVLATFVVSARADTFSAVHQQRYAMGTMFDIVVFHHSRADAMRAVGRAFAEIDRLERVMSHYRSDSDLSKLNREARHRPMRVDPSLHEVLRESIEFSRRSRGRFDVTIAPLLRLWKSAATSGSAPAAEAIERARRCVGYEKIDISGADGIRFRSDCVEIDLGGIGKGYAVDRALAVLTSAGIRHAMVNAGGSSIAAIGSPPGRDGWPVRLGGEAGGTVLLLSGQSVSTSQQDPAKPFGEIVDPLTGAPSNGADSVSVVAPSATASDALSTTVLMLPVEEAKGLLSGFPDVSAVWISSAGHRRAAFRESRLRLQTPTGAEVFVRWTAGRVPPRGVLGTAKLALPAANAAAVREALAQEYRVYLEIDGAGLTSFASPARGVAGVIVRGRSTAAALSALRERLAPLNVRVLAVDERGKWPHIRSTRVTKNSAGVLQVASRSAQPWIDSNAALARIAGRAGVRPLLTYTWTPIGLAEADEGPAVENYLVAIAEAGSFGADLLLPLHERFQQRILLGEPAARREWDQIRRYLSFYTDDSPGRYQPIASIGIVTDAPMDWFEVMNLLARHNLPFHVVASNQLSVSIDPSLKMLVVLGEPDAAQKSALAAFEQGGGIVRIVSAPGDPNRLALDIRRQLGPDKRTIDIFNGITVIAAPYAGQAGSVVVTLVNYAHQPLPVQLRVAGIFSEVRYESPEEKSSVLPYEHRNGSTEFALPLLRVGGRILLRTR